MVVTGADEVIAKLSNFEKEEENKTNRDESCNNITLIESDSDDYKSISLSIINSSFFNNEDL